MPDELRELASIVLGAARERSLLTQSALGQRTLAQTILWADTVSRSHVATGQPSAKLRNYARNSATEAYSDLPDALSFASASSWHARLANDESDIVRGKEWSDYLASVFERAAARPRSSASVRRWGLELAAGLIEEERSIDDLARDLGRVGTNAAPSGDTPLDRVRSLMLPAASIHLVVVGVLGATELSDVETVAGGLAVSLADVHRTPSYRDWGRSGGKAAEFVRLASNHGLWMSGRDQLPGPRVFLQVRVTSPDSASAGTRAISVTQRVLDIYHAAHPTAMLAIFPVVGVAREGDSRGRFTIHNRDDRKWRSIALLGSNVHQALAPASRVNSLARVTPKTVTRASFSWVAIEAAGATAADFDSCGKALALLELRQRFFSAYRTFVRFSTASSSAHNARARHADILARRAHRLRRQGVGGEHLNRLSLAAVRLDTSAVFNRRLAILYQREANDARDLVNRVGVAEGGVAYGDRKFGTLGDFSAWARILREWKMGIEAAEPAAIRAIVKRMAPENGGELDSVAGVSASAHSALIELEAKAAFYAAQVAALYAARNLHLHDGLHDVPGEVSLANAGPTIVDSLLEIWGIWLDPPTNKNPATALTMLSQRYSVLTARLASGVLIEELDVGSLASPMWSPINS